MLKTGLQYFTFTALELKNLLLKRIFTIHTLHVNVNVPSKSNKQKTQ
jgi:hypothetical protein